MAGPAPPPQISQASDPLERSTAQFVLLYKDLLRGQFATFAEDLQQLPASPAADKIGTSLGYVYDGGQGTDVVPRQRRQGRLWLHLPDHRANRQHLAERPERPPRPQLHG